MIKKLTCLIITLLFLVSLCGCGVDFYAGRRPAANANEKWISEDPEMYFTWVEDTGHCGAITIDSEATEILVCFDYGTGMDVFPLEKESDIRRADQRLFAAYCKFGKDKLVVTVRQDDADLFNGDLPTITFIRHELQENER